MHRGVAASMAGALVLTLAAGAARAGTIEIKISNLTFEPAEVSAHVGDTIKWVNDDFIAHSATARNGAWDVMIPVHAARSVVLHVEGTVDYYCTIHPNMTGRITVTK